MRQSPTEHGEGVRDSRGSGAVLVRVRARSREERERTGLDDDGPAQGTIEPRKAFTPCLPWQC